MIALPAVLSIAPNTTNNMKFEHHVGMILLACFFLLGTRAAAHGRTPIELAQANVVSPSKQVQNGWDPRGQVFGSPRTRGPAFRCFSDSDCPNGFPCLGAQPDEGRDGLCGYDGPTKLQPVKVPVTPHPTCLVDADCDPGRRCEGNRPQMGVRGACIGSVQAPRAEANKPNPPK